MSRAIGLLLCLCCSAFAAGGVLIVADEIPAMQVLAAKLKTDGNFESVIVKQTEMPPDLSGYAAVFVYIHRDITEPAEKAFIAYANAGGKLILLHHSISSGKRRNKYWFGFLGISLPEKDFSQGGYKWLDPVDWQVVNLAPRDHVTSHRVKYAARITYKSSDTPGREKRYPGLAFENSEVYLNHVYTEPRTILMGLKYRDPKSGVTYMQDRAAWYKKAGQGLVMYFMPGHSAREFEDPAYAQILLNAVQFQQRP